MNLSFPNSVAIGNSDFELATLCLQQCHLPTDVTFIDRIGPWLQKRGILLPRSSESQSI